MTRSIRINFPIIFQIQSPARPQAIFTSFKLEKNGKNSPVINDNLPLLKSPTNQISPENAHLDGSASKDSCTSNNNGSDRKRRLSFSSSPSNDSEKVSIVRAAGTFFPQNCDDDLDSSASSGRNKSKNVSSSELAMPAAKKCRVSMCSHATDSHVHCGECSEVCIYYLLYKFCTEKIKNNISVLF